MINNVFTLNKGCHENENIYITILNKIKYYEIIINYEVITNYESVQFVKNNYIGLPIELNRFICKFMKNIEFIKISFTVQNKNIFPLNYTHYPPNWEIIAFDSNINTNIDLMKYFKKLVDSYNNNNYIFWREEIDIDLEILNFIDFVNHFSKIYNQDNFN